MAPCLTMEISEFFQKMSRLDGDVWMNEEQKAWQRQFESNFGAREFLRFGVSFALWMVLGVVVTALVNPAPIFAAFVISALLLSVFLFAFLSRSWKPAYKLLCFILGNKELPEEPFPGPRVRRPVQPRPWWSFLPGLWFWLLSLLVFYFAIKY